MTLSHPDHHPAGQGGGGLKGGDSDAGTQARELHPKQRTGIDLT
eukprot:CAMPEP_0172196510 /NCGR_PEP_ID=MMETSP1050-20130122/26870_1 /TAXON_ID=233186 /ORGANISM="Cryptomonas curvata, Strain CCAP979/52" /LENGTH=43 /DNA_ID= /DNA_START= /DNA_END= /DNA_ORIENTATION=